MFWKIKKSEKSGRTGCGFTKKKAAENGGITSFPLIMSTGMIKTQKDTLGDLVVVTNFLIGSAAFRCGRYQTDVFF